MTVGIFFPSIFQVATCLFAGISHLLSSGPNEPQGSGVVQIQASYRQIDNPVTCEMRLFSKNYFRKIKRSGMPDSALEEMIEIFLYRKLKDVQMTLDACAVLQYVVMCTGFSL